MLHKSTHTAVLLKEALERRGLRVLSEVNDGHKRIDLGIPDAHINIEVDGIQHLTNPRQILSDLKREHYSDLLGYDTIHVPNELVYEDLERIAEAIAEAARTRMR